MIFIEISSGQGENQNKWKDNMRIEIFMTKFSLYV